MVSNFTHFIIRQQFKDFATAFAFWLAILLLTQQGSAQHRFNVWQSHGPTYDITSLEVAPSSLNVLVAAGGDYCCGWGVFKTTNYGFNWLETGLTAEVPDALGPVAIDPTDARVFYVYKVPLGVFKTTNGGQSWNLFLPNFVESLEIAPSDRNVLYAMGEFLYVSANGGAIGRRAHFRFKAAAPTERLPFTRTIRMSSLLKLVMLTLWAGHIKARTAD
jgi:hypothetical protein